MQRLEINGNRLPRHYIMSNVVFYACTGIIRLFADYTAKFLNFCYPFRFLNHINLDGI